MPQPPLYAPEILEPSRCQLGVSDCVLDVLMAEIGLKCSCVVALIGEPVAARVPQHVWMGLEGSLALIPARSTILANPAVVKGAPRSDVKTKGDLGSCSL